MSYNIADLFERAVDAVPDRVALVVGDHHLTFGQIDETANRLAQGWPPEGSAGGDHVGIYGQSSPAWVQAMMAAFKLRAVPVNINFRYVSDELAYLFGNADLVALVHDRQYAPRVASVRKQVPSLRCFVSVDDGTDPDPAVLGALGSEPLEDVLAEGSPARDFPARSADDHYVLYTGGTTGLPKGGGVAPRGCVLRSGWRG